MAVRGITQLPIPPHFDAANAARWSYNPDILQLAARAEEWRRAHQIAPSSGDTFNLHLLLIDLQKDFCFPEGTLYVGGRGGTGAIDDNARLARFIYRELHNITHISTTLDSHLAFQIFFPWFFVDRDERTLQPHAVVTTQMIRGGEVRPNPALVPCLPVPDYAWLERQTLYYCEELERAGKYALYLWPPHCILGSEGHSLAGVIYEARMFHAFARFAQSWVEVKGSNPLTENYSVLRPEVLLWFNGEPLARKNGEFIRTLLNADAVVIAGQAASHCVRSSVLDLLDEINATNPELAGKFTILRDCMSAVAVPDGQGGFLSDFTAEAEGALARFAEAGMHVVDSTLSIEQWDWLQR